MNRTGITILIPLARKLKLRKFNEVFRSLSIGEANPQLLANCLSNI